MISKNAIRSWIRIIRMHVQSDRCFPYQPFLPLLVFSFHPDLSAHCACANSLYLSLPHRFMPLPVNTCRQLYGATNNTPGAFFRTATSFSPALSAKPDFLKEKMETRQWRSIHLDWDISCLSVRVYVRSRERERVKYSTVPASTSHMSL